MKPWKSSATKTDAAIIDESVAYKKVTKGLTPQDEKWLRDVTGRFCRISFVTLVTAFFTTALRVLGLSAVTVTSAFETRDGFLLRQVPAL